MKLLKNSTELEKEFQRLIQEYKHFDWATAWASASSKSFEDLLNNQNKIRRITVGIHFYQTHPDFIEAFLNNQNVHFIQQPEGIFHPKVYLFSNNDNEWEVIIGSANFTKEAFSRNTEASVLIKNGDNDAQEIYNDVLKLTEEVFKNSIVFTKYDLENYRKIWKIQKEKIKSLSGQYGSKKRKPKPIFEVPLTTRSWEDFIEKVYNEKHHALDKRLQVIEIAKGLFEKVTHFSDLNEDERKFIAGIPNNLKIKGSENWGYFGSMMGAGKFKNRIKENDNLISKALDQIPLSGQITRKHYDDYIKYFSEALPGNFIATATRLLCMKRPDTFVCFDSKNRSELCKDFGIIQSEMDFDRYWEDIIKRIYDSEWWQNPNPQNEIEEKISNARGAFLDSLYYDE